MFVFVIRSIREKKGITAYRLSKLTGINRSYLTELENNKKFNPSLKTMYKIANALEVKIDDLFYSELDIEKLKEELNRRIEIYGTTSKEAMKVSQIIDLLINVKNVKITNIIKMNYLSLNYQRFNNIISEIKL